MPAKKPIDSTTDALLAGVTASSGMTDIGRTLGKSTPEHVGEMAAKLQEGNGWDQVRNAHGLIFGTAFVAAIVGGLIYAFDGTPTAGILALLFLIVGGFALFGVGMGIALQMTAYVPIRFRARLFPPVEPNINAGTMLTGHPLTELIFIIPFKVAALLIALPFWMIGSVLEVLRVVGLNLIGKKASYRGDQGKYYDAVRKQYAAVYHDQGEAAAKEYLRLAYSGLLTPIGVEIPADQWFGDDYKQWLAPMIERHGPVDKFCTGNPGLSTKAYKSMGSDTLGKPNQKYDAI